MSTASIAAYFPWRRYRSARTRLPSWTLFCNALEQRRVLFGDQRLDALVDPLCDSFLPVALLAQRQRRHLFLLQERKCAARPHYRATRKDCPDVLVRSLTQAWASPPFLGGTSCQGCLSPCGRILILATAISALPGHCSFQPQ